MDTQLEPQKKILLKPSENRDFEDYYAIRCGDSDVFWMGYEKRPEREIMHQVFEERLGNSRLEQIGDKRIYMITANGKNVGFIQFSVIDEGIEFGCSVLDKERGKGYGFAGIKQAVILAKNIARCCIAHIRDDNIASQKVFIGAGFTRTSEVEMKHFFGAGVKGYRKYELKFS